MRVPRADAPAGPSVVEWHTCADFAYAKIPGVYRLTARYSNQQADAWHGVATSGCVTVVVE